MNHRQRFLQGLFICIITIFVPLSIAAGVYFRSMDYTMGDSLWDQYYETPAYSMIISPEKEMFQGLPIMAVVRGDENGGRQLELDVQEDLQLPKTLLFWAANRTEETPIEQWKLLGPVWGPGSRIYELPEAAIGGEGIFYIFSMAKGEIVASGYPPVTN